MAAGEGGRVGAFVVSAIAAGEVTVLDPYGRAQVLRPRTDPAIRAAVAAVAPDAPAAGATRAASSSVLDLLQSIPGEGVKPGAATGRATLP